MNTWWYINRSAGLVAWLLLAGSIILGLLLSSKAAGRKLRPNWVQDLHRGLSGLGVAFVGVHILGAVADSYVHFGWADTLIPFASSWRPTAIAYGVVTLYLLVAVEATSLARKHLPKSVWRRTHLLSFPLFITATLHGITAGSDVRTVTAIAAISLLSAAIMGLTVYRVLDHLETKDQPAVNRVPAARPPAPTPPPQPQPQPPVRSF